MTLQDMNVEGEKDGPESTRRSTKTALTSHQKQGDKRLHPSNNVDKNLCLLYINIYIPGTLMPRMKTPSAKKCL